MAISFNNIPETTRTPGAYLEVDNSRALKGLIQNPHKVLIIGDKQSAAPAAYDTLYAISKDGLADGYFGPGSIAARMCNIFKQNNPNTELYAMVIGSGIAGVQASATIDISAAMIEDEASGVGTYCLMINGTGFDIPIASNMSGQGICSLIVATIDPYSQLPVVASVALGTVYFSAVCSGSQGNYINIRHNYYAGQSIPSAIFSAEPVIVSMADGTLEPDLGDAWAIIGGEQFHYIIQPWVTPANLKEIEDELADRFLPLEDLQGHGFTAMKTSGIGSATTLGNSRNSPHNTIIPFDDSPSAPEEWAAALGAVAAAKLNDDPARPLHFLPLKGILPPPVDRRFIQSERETLLYDGMATWIVDSGGNVLIKRCITTYQKNALGLADPSYLDVQTLATLGEIRYQYKARMANRFLIPRFKLADDTFPVQPGSWVVTPKTIKAETIALFTQLRDAGLIENLDEFIENLVVERDATDVNRVNVLLPPDLINQFRVLAGVIQFIL